MDGLIRVRQVWFLSATFGSCGVLIRVSDGVFGVLLVLYRFLMYDSFPLLFVHGMFALLT